MLIEKLTQGGTTMAVVGVRPGDDLVACAGEHLARDGVVLLRGLGIDGSERFHEAVSAFGGSLINSYRGGNTPRTTVSEGVFTSTEYPARYEITLHNEMSYAHRWPSRLFFSCVDAADTGGATPVCDGGALLAGLSPDVRERFETRGVLYRTHLHGGAGLGKSWQQTFETSDPATVEEFLRSSGAEFSWTAEGALRVSQRRPAVRRHPDTGAVVWFNQADQWHPSNLPEDEAELLLSVVDDEADLPHSVAYGDGSPIPAADLADVRKAQRAGKLAMPWHEGDLMVVDNMRVLHGREPFTGSRRVLVSMT
ncbi:Taurine dioxygenase, alpha-ketoglutarate-dependent [Lentzea albidocapillata subsp. violacea]|uniref:Taurine dioxygenase, alpha-ketoglutarate-dependent n=1 Tax=Lentzea albidocapillata subsp. violacea TaxID=128104 RepID=A0A1G9JJH6_9PSEU|nr:TauD/TfdA family dioxygenase [Lentzea albidocapillata]SDL37760.1 Taurine dioxygenase, alpha-ketoglutarate-dependent [Lentzea albidocapillata subsp. violacea]